MHVKLTPKQEKFCHAYMELGDATKAYRAAGYSPSMPDKTKQEEACRLLKNPKVSARIAELRAPAAEKARMTLEGHLLDLERLRDMAAERNQIGAAIAAEIARGKAAGVHIEKTESTVTTKQLPASVDEFV
jgi:phage terminase small subunit